MEEQFNIDAFLEGIERDRSKSEDFDPSKVLNAVMMSSADNQGIITFIPFLSKTYKNFYLKVKGVLEYYGDTTLTNSGEGWFRLLPIEFYGQLTEAEMDLYSKIHTLYDEIMEYEPSYTEFRIRTYSLFHGIQLSHVKDSDKSKNDKYDNCACLYIFPSNRVIDAFNTAINSKIDVMKGSKSWIPAVLSPSNTGRRGVMQISFVKSTGAGYDASVSFEFNSDFQMLVDPDKVFPDEMVDLFDNTIKGFLGWRYDKTNDKAFNLAYMQEFRDALLKRLSQLKKGELPKPAEEGKVYQNQNNADPNKGDMNTAAPQADPAPATEPGPQAAPKVAPPF